jgi:membrane-associated protease RseP (regulator of RpoE activity)
MTPPLSYLVVRVAEHCTHVALHEAGHAIVGRSFSMRAETSLLMKGRALSGCTDHYGDFTEHQFRIVALAGSVATTLWQRPDVTAEQLIQENWTPTPLDAKDADNFGADHLAECLQIVRSHWRDVEAEAALLLEDLARAPK